MTGSDLKCRVEVCRRVEGVNALGEVTYAYEPERKVWARIVPVSGRTAELAGGVERVEATHRVTIRRGAIPELTTDLQLRFRGQRYEVISFYPNYRESGFVEMQCRLVVEDGIQSF